jgi:hypothetical protein
MQWAEGNLMKALIVAAMLFAALSSPALAAPPQSTLSTDRPVAVITLPGGWVSEQRSNGLVHSEPLSASAEGRPGYVNCNVTIGEDEVTRGWSQDQLERDLKRSAAAFFNTNFSVPGVEVTIVAQDEVLLAGHKASLIMGKGKIASPPIFNRSVAVFYAMPGFVAIAVCTVGDQTDEAAEAAWRAWQPVLLPIIKSLNIQFHH